MKKSPDAFRTISEVSEWLETPAHVLRFWESRFSQVKPVKRAGGRRYYRPNDMLLLGGIKRLLHEDGMTIRGAQKVLREQGVKNVAALSQPLTTEADLELTATPVPDPAAPATAAEAPMAVDVPQPPVSGDVAQTDNVVPLSPSGGQQDLPLGPTEPAEDAPAQDAPGNLGQPPQSDTATDQPEPPARQATGDSPHIPEAAEQAPLPLDGADDTPARDAAAPPAPTEHADAAELRPLGADLPKNDPSDDDDSFVRHMPPPLTIQLRDRVVRLKLSQEHRDEINAAMSRLNTLQDRMSNGG